MLDISAALNDAYKRTKYLLWERRSFGRWWRFALLSMLTGGGGGGGFNFRLPLQLLQANKKETAMLGMVLATGAVGDFDTAMLPFFIGFAVGIFAFAIFFVWLSNCAQFVLVESIVYDRHVLGEPFGRLKSSGTGLFLWTFLVGLACMIPAGGVIAGGIGVGYMAGGDSPGTVLMIGLSTLALLAVLGLGICTLFALTTQLVVPVAYRQRLGISSAWSLVWQTLRQRKADTCLFLLVLVGVAMAGAFGVMMGIMLVTGLVAMVSGIVLGLPAFFLYQQQMAVPAVICAVLFGVVVLGALFVSSLAFQTPLTVLTRCFGMYIMQQMMPEFGLLPLGGIPEQAQAEEPILSHEPQPLGAVPQDSWQRPEF
ncbi:MAG: hypothetical protein KF760_19080 [Candidatus Eremiobacteraeota bacterium]|nr:hypothetical protein [Candidatus Eremiobacteraeota bacterium]MCW5870277.1 hypothetical protein [Candidatus Eremiobacteraeota bacterium]